MVMNNAEIFSERYLYIILMSQIELNARWFD